MDAEVLVPCDIGSTGAAFAGFVTDAMDVGADI